MTRSTRIGFETKEQTFNKLEIADAYLLVKCSDFKRLTVEKKLRIHKYETIWWNY